MPPDWNLVLDDDCLVIATTFERAAVQSLKHVGYEGSVTSEELVKKYPGHVWKMDRLLAKLSWKEWSLETPQVEGNLNLVLLHITEDLRCLGRLPNTAIEKLATHPGPEVVMAHISWSIRKDFKLSFLHCKIRGLDPNRGRVCFSTTISKQTSTLSMRLLHYNILVPSVCLASTSNWQTTLNQSRTRR